jgi:hypothetical protein
MIILKDLLVQFEKYLTEGKSAMLKKLGAGISEGDIVKLIPANNRPLITLYSWKDGIKYNSDWTSGELDFFSFGIFLSLEDVIEHRNVLFKSVSIENEFLLPVFTTGTGEYILYDTAADSNGKGNLFIYAPMLVFSENPMPIYDSLESFFATVNECYRTGAYKFDSEGKLEIDYDLEQEISTRLNPASEYWNQ